MSQYVLSLLTFVVKEGDQFLTNSEDYNINTGLSSNLHLPSASLFIKREFTIGVLRFLIVFLQH